MPRALAIGLTAVAVLWTVVLFAAPAALPRGGGATVGAAALYASASRFCHQQPDRSFALAGTQFPVCARCAGLYVSGALGALLAWAPRRRRPGQRDRLVLAASAVPTALTWSLEFAGLIDVSNIVRAVAAVPLGAAAGWVFVRTLRDEAQVPAGRPVPAEPRALS